MKIKICRTGWTKSCGNMRQRKSWHLPQLCAWIISGRIIEKKTQICLLKKSRFKKLKLFEIALAINFTERKKYVFFNYFNADSISYRFCSIHIFCAAVCFYVIFVECFFFFCSHAADSVKFTRA